MEGDRSNLITLLRDHDAPCPSCGYNLRGAKHDSCPECGRPFDFNTLVQSRQRLDWAWVITLAAMAVCLVESALKWQRLIIRRNFFYSFDPQVTTRDLDTSGWVLGTLSYAYWLSVPAVIVLLVLLRKRFARLPRWLRISIAVLAVIATILAHRRLQFWYWWLGLDAWLAPHDFETGARWPDWWLSH